jgi:predicted glycogen debranching enzyme
VPAARSGVGAELVLAADQFVITPSGRREDAARARAAGGEVRSIIAGYHWFTDWGRDTMISLEGLTCTTGRHVEASYILRTFGQYVRDGLIPNMFPDGSNEGLYHTADATLWFFHAIDRYLAATGDRATLAALMPKLTEIVQCHLEGTRYGIHVDPKDGLLVQGADGYQLTWMDAKCDGWVVTPRRGKAVEINALWYNALRLFEGWTREAAGDEAAHPFAVHAEQCRLAFNERFWYRRAGISTTSSRARIWPAGRHRVPAESAPRHLAHTCRP